MRRIFAILIIGGLLLFGGSLAVVQSADTDEQRKVAERFLVSYFTQDMKGVRATLPDTDAELFVPYPFKGAIKLETPKVDDGQALIDFTCPVVDPKFPARGGLLMRKDDEVWHVRQVLFYDKVPKLFRLPSKSVTDADKRQEPRVQAVGKAFLNAWERGETEKMLDHWYNWPNHTKDILKGMSVNNLVFTNGVTAWKDPYLGYTAKLTYRWGPLSYSMDVKGGLVMAKEKDAWKVRANQLVFDF